jgi:hypothetical protein
VIDVRFGKDFYAGLVLAVLAGWMLSESQKIRRLRFDVLDNAFFSDLGCGVVADLLGGFDRASVAQ